MERDESLELLNATHTFPCAFTIKVIGIAENDFVTRVVDVLLEFDAQVSFQTRSTPNGKHVAVTLEPELDSAEQVVLIYERVRTIDGVVMTM